MMARLSVPILFLSAAADLALWHPETELSAAESVILAALGGSALFWLALWVSLKSRGLCSGLGFRGLFCLYLLYSCFQLRYLLELIWQSKIAAAVFPVLFLAAAIWGPVQSSGGLCRFGDQVFGLFALGSLVFLLAVWQNFRPAYLALPQVKGIGPLLAKSGLFYLAVPEIFLFSGEKRAIKPLHCAAFSGLYCLIFSGIKCITEGTFGPNSGKGLYHAALLGQLLSMERVETLQVILWVLLLLCRFRAVGWAAAVNCHRRTKWALFFALSAGYMAASYFSGAALYLKYGIVLGWWSLLLFSFVRGGLNWKK